MSDVTNRLSKSGDYIETVAEGVTIRLQVTVDGAYDRRVYAGPTEIGELHTTHTDERIARAQCSHIRAALLAGVRVDQIALEHTTNGHTVVQVAEEVLTEALRVATADPDTITAEPTVAALQKLLPVDDAADAELVARVNAHLDEVHAGRPIAGTVPSGHFRQVAPTMAGAHLEPVNEAQQAAIDSHSDGVVQPSKAANRRTLKALARKGYGHLNYGQPAPGKPAIRSLTLNARGLAKAQVTA